ncbi:hypothetical protein B0H63DRAFT_507373 [Podospora didyma]|uniref:Heterokaryon incompatibility domain-containing protein n=1 Tax=Podospora didyma TaxID=330526 RepID=A0AAE0NYS7_9PEZI|nr:hypothetical protein B0H63DRAFT_507373 [Podospora didyma]
MRDLCERRYWRRMWIIPEILQARRITVGCGNKSFAWNDFEALYLRLKTLGDPGWLVHHEFATSVLQSPACVMAW